MRQQIYLPDDLGEDIRALGDKLNVSAVCQEALRRELRRRSAVPEDKYKRDIKDMNMRQLVDIVAVAHDHAIDHQGRIAVRHREAMGELVDRLEGLEL